MLKDTMLKDTKNIKIGVTKIQKNKVSPVLRFNLKDVTFLFQSLILPSKKFDAKNKLDKDDFEFSARIGNIKKDDENYKTIETVIKYANDIAKINDVGVNNIFKLNESNDEPGSFYINAKRDSVWFQCFYLQKKEAIPIVDKEKAISIELKKHQEIAENGEISIDYTDPLYLKEKLYPGRKYSIGFAVYYVSPMRAFTWKIRELALDKNDDTQNTNNSNFDYGIEYQDDVDTFEDDVDTFEDDVDTKDEKIPF